MKRLVWLLAVLALAADAASGPTPSADVRLFVFDCGRILLTTPQMFSIGAEETDVRELAVPCYVVEHPNGRLLWDGGIRSSMAATPGWQGGAIKMRLDRTLADQLGALGYGLGDFEYVAFSHMHSDHVGVANEIRNATLLIQRPEFEAQFADAVDPRGGVDPTLYEGLRELDRVLLDGDHDVFGDSRVRIISAPGHTPGHQVLWIDLANSGPVLIAGDLYHFALSRREQRIPTFNVDAEMTLASMDRVEALVEETGATLWIEHELALFETLDLAPAWYD